MEKDEFLIMGTIFLVSLLLGMLLAGFWGPFFAKVNLSSFLI